MNEKRSNLSTDAIAELIFECGVLPEITDFEAPHLPLMLGAYCEGGIHVLEFHRSALSNPASVTAALSAGLQIGFTQIRTQTEVIAAKQAGADFIVTEPGCPEAAEACVSFGLPIFVGCQHRYHISEALAKGLTHFQFYPALDAAPADTISYLSELMAAYPNARFIVGRHTFSHALTNAQLYELENTHLSDFMRPRGILAACLGSLTQNDAFEQGNATALTELTSKQRLDMHAFSFGHMCINLPDSVTNTEVADQFAAAFGFPTRDTGGTVFASEQIEIGHGKLGENGHIGIISVCVARALPYLDEKGYRFNWETLQTKFGRPSFIFMENCIGGFAVHVAQYIF